MCIEFYYLSLELADAYQNIEIDTAETEIAEAIKEIRKSTVPD